MVEQGENELMSVPENPFPASYGRDQMQLPDVPLQEDGTSRMLKILIDNESTPLETRKKFHWIHSRDLILTFLDEERKRSKMLGFDILKLHALNNTPWYEYDFEMEQEWQEERFELEVRCDRALGFDKSHRINERIVQSSQFQESRQIMHDETSRQMTGGFFSKMAGFITRR